MTGTVSLIIATCNRLESLLTTLQSVAGQHLDAHEVIVVDQSARRFEYEQIVRSAYPFVSYITLQKPNLPKARNAGILHSNGDIILFIDDDVTLHDNFIAAHRSAHQKPNIACVGGRIIQSSPAGTVVAFIDKTTGESRSNFNQTSGGEILYACGCNMSFKRTALVKAGMFDQRFIGNALFEEVDLCFRLKRQGGAIWFEPGATLTHHQKTTGGCHEQKNAPYLIDRIHNHALFYFRHISTVPSRFFLIYIRNIAEYASRRADRSHDSAVLVKSIIAVIGAFFQSYLTVKQPKRCL